MTLAWFGDDVRMNEWSFEWKVPNIPCDDRQINNRKQNAS